MRDLNKLHGRPPRRVGLLPLKKRWKPDERFLETFYTQREREAFIRVNELLGVLSAYDAVGLVHKYPDRKVSYAHTSETGVHTELTI